MRAKPNSGRGGGRQKKGGRRSVVVLRVDVGFSGGGGDGVWSLGSCEWW